MKPGAVFFLEIQFLKMRIRLLKHTQVINLDTLLCWVMAGLSYWVNRLIQMENVLIFNLKDQDKHPILDVVMAELH